MSKVKEELLNKLSVCASFLFDKLDFSLIHREVDPKQQYELIVLESPRFGRLRFYQHLWDLEVEVRPSTAPLKMEDSNGWYSPQSILDFLDKKPLKLDEALRQEPFFSPDERMRYCALLLAKYYDQAGNFFMGEGYMSRLAAYEQFYELRAASLRQQLAAPEARQLEQRRAKLSREG